MDASTRDTEADRTGSRLGGALEPERDLRRTRTSATAFRVVLAVGIVAVSSLVEGVGSTERTAFGYALAFGWIPATGLLDAAHRRRPGLAVDLVTMLLDLGVLAALLAVFDGGTSFVLAAQALPVAYWCYVRGRVFGLVVVALATGIAVGIAAAPRWLASASAPEPFELVLYPVVMGVVVLLLDAARGEHERVATQVAHLHGKADEAKTMFLATATHELKTPLTVIAGYAELMERQPDLDEEERAWALRSIQERVRELDDIVDRVLMSSRIEAGRIDLHVGSVDLGPLVTERVEAVRVATERVVEARGFEANPTVLADPEALATVVDHLLDNAVKYSPDGGTVRVEAEVAGDRVDVRVADEGVGMSNEEAERCFERFWQAESGDMRRFGGTGIGLYIVKSLVEAMGGRIDVESAPGEGATFSVRLRRADVDRKDVVVDVLAEPVGR